MTTETVCGHTLVPLARKRRWRLSADILWFPWLGNRDERHPLESGMTGLNVKGKPLPFLFHLFPFLNNAKRLASFSSSCSPSYPGCDWPRVTQKLFCSVFTGMDKCKINTVANISGCDTGAVPMECYMVLNGSAQIVITVLCCAFGGLCILENALVLYLIFSSPKIRKKPSYLFISSLALADILASVIFACSFVQFHVFKVIDSSKEVFLLKLGGVNLSFTASLSSLLLMAVDRHICILKPSRYKSLVTSQRALVAMAVLWVTITFLAFLPLLGWNCCRPRSVCSELFPFVDNAYLSSWIVLVVLLLALIVYAYMHILWKARKHTLYMEKYHMQTSQQKMKVRIDIMLAKTLVIILALLVMCWSPALGLMAYSLFVKLDDYTRKVFAFCSTLCLLNSMVNPVIYALRSRELMRHTKLFGCFISGSGLGMNWQVLNKYLIPLEDLHCKNTLAMKLCLGISSNSTICGQYVYLNKGYVFAVFLQGSRKKGRM
uniref:Cannabinoid receptor 2 n=1 Tax=Varanus komodoensis TaxID=61221 RepID=A0A8D2L598_VARKO